MSATLSTEFDHTRSLEYSFDRRPAIVVMPATSADVVSAVRFAREHDLSIVAQGGGHGHPRPANDALLVNFASMTSVQVTPVPAASNSSGQSFTGYRSNTNEVTMPKLPRNGRRLCPTR
jgi:FAD/FMN-containing dehydrogenase